MKQFPPPSFGLNPNGDCSDDDDDDDDDDGNDDDDDDDDRCKHTRTLSTRNEFNRKAG